MSKEEKPINVNEIYQDELDFLAAAEKVAQNENISKEELTIEYNSIVKKYKSLLKDTIKITRIGDSSQKKLILAKEEIEGLNSKLQESEQNLKELNSIIMHYIKATEK